jgi:hypothetical protein
VTQAFLDYSKSQGNDLITPRPEYKWVHLPCLLYYMAPLYYMRLACAYVHVGLGRLPLAYCCCACLSGMHE